MALDNKVLIDEEILTTLSNKAFGDGISHSIQDIVSNLGPNISDIFTDEEKYGYVVVNGTSSAGIGVVTLPDGISYNDIVFGVGIGGYNNSSVSSRTALHIPYIYCPAIYNHIIKTDETTGEVLERDCFGFTMGGYTSTYEQDVWTPIATGNIYGTSHRATIFKSTDGADGSHRIGLGFYQGNTLQSHTGYIAARYGSAIFIYRKK